MAKATLGVSIATRLANIDAHLASKLAAVAASLQPPAKPAAIDKLAKLFAGTVPADVRAWFRWHDGQRHDSFEALIPETSWSALPCKRVLDTHHFLTATARDSSTDIMLPVKDAWIPLFENGGGDHLCLDRESGKVITWYHDDKSRPVAFRSFAALVETIEKGYARMKAVEAFPGPRVTAWKALARRPSEAQLDAAPVAAAYAFVRDLPMGRRQFIAVKLGDGRWIDCFGTTLAGALDHWKKHAAKPPAESSGYYKTTWDVWWAMRDAKDAKRGT